VGGRRGHEAGLHGGQNRADAISRMRQVLANMEHGTWNMAQAFSYD